MAKKLPIKMTRIETCEEPEIQYHASEALFTDLRAWLVDQGAVHKKRETDMAVYCDTRNFRLAREGIEYRIKERGDKWRHDMKTPVDTHCREVVPDEHGILHRNELKFKSGVITPSLANFFGQAILRPVQARVHDLFDKKLEEKFRTNIEKDKWDLDTPCGTARVECSFQTGYLETMDGTRRKQIKIFEMELREGHMDGLLSTKQRIEKRFGPEGLIILPERKVIMGLALHEPDMTDEQKRKFADVRRRNSPDYVAPARQTSGQFIAAA